MAEKTMPSVTCAKSMHINYEFKARCSNLEELEARLNNLNPLFRGTDHQTDTYFNVANGRMKLREGKIENALIHYNRTDIAGPKQSDVILYPHHPDKNLKQLLTKSLGVKVIVTKQRTIYFIGNIKFHFDVVQGLGSFIEIEAIDKDGSIGVEKLKAQCEVYIQLFRITPDQFVGDSYSDLLVKKSSTP